MRRLPALLTLLAGPLVAMAAIGGLPGTARAAALTDCLASHHVCVADAGRGLISGGQQDVLEQKIGSDEIYLVVGVSGSAGYDGAMNQIIKTLSARHGDFVVGYADSSLRHFGAYNDGVLPAGDAARIATTAIQGNGGSLFAAMQDFVRQVQDQEQGGPAAGDESSGQSQGSTSSSGLGWLVFLGVIVVAALTGYLGFIRPRRRRREQEEAEQLKEAKAAAADDLIALSERVTSHAGDVTIQGDSAAADEQAAALDAYERGMKALDAARRPADMAAVSRAIAEGQYRLACAEALANGQPKPGRRPMCFFDPRHGMSVADVSWAPPDGGPSREVAACVDCNRIVERGDQPAIRMVGDRSGQQVMYVNSGAAPAYWGGFGYGGSMLAGFALGELLSGPAIYGGPFYGGPGYYDAGPGFVGGDQAGGDSSFGGGDFGGGDFGGGDFGGGDFGGGFSGGDSSFGGGDF